MDHFKLQHALLEVNGILKSPRINISGNWERYVVNGQCRGDVMFHVTNTYLYYHFYMYNYCYNYLQLHSSKWNITICIVKHLQTNSIYQNIRTIKTITANVILCSSSLNINYSYCCFHKNASIHLLSTNNCIHNLCHRLKNRLICSN